jgi:acetyl-CoA carboxylase carboxyl transferase subunit alpha
VKRYVMDFERPLAELESKLDSLRELEVSEEPELAAEIEQLTVQVDELRETLYTSLSPWEKVQVSRHPDRPRTQDYVGALFTDVVELRGDRAFRDDPAVFTGLATIAGRRVVVLGHRKGKTAKENAERNFGMAHPEGLRKALRGMRLADKHGLPIVSFVDTPGASPGVGAEERGQAWAIAECLATLSAVGVPVVAVGIGEGGSGGALAIGFGDRLIMLEHAYYSVITPESCASILVREPDRAGEMAESLALTAEDLVEMGLADEIVPEPLGGAHRDPGSTVSHVGRAVVAGLEELSDRDADGLVEERYERLRSIGEFTGAG